MIAPDRHVRRASVRVSAQNRSGKKARSLAAKFQSTAEGEKTEKPFAESDVMQSLLVMMKNISAEPDNTARAEKAQVKTSDIVDEVIDYSQTEAVERADNTEKAESTEITESADVADSAEKIDSVEGAVFTEFTESRENVVNTNDVESSEAAESTQSVASTENAEDTDTTEIAVSTSQLSDSPASRTVVADETRGELVEVEVDGEHDSESQDEELVVRSTKKPGFFKRLVTKAVSWLKRLVGFKR